MNHQPRLRVIKCSSRERQWADTVERRRRKRYLPVVVIMALVWGGMIAMLVGAFLATQFRP